LQLCDGWSEKSTRLLFETSQSFEIEDSQRSIAHAHETGTLKAPQCSSALRAHASRSRFIPAAILGHFEQSSWPTPAAGGEAAIAPAAAAVDLTEHMRAMWR
jgi:hypothetical protein